MKKYIKSSSDGRQYYAYPTKELRRIIDDYLYWKNESYLDDLGEGAIITEPPLYAFIANSEMTDIDVAFISKDESQVTNLSWKSPDVALLLGGENDSLEYDEIINRLSAKGIAVLDDESGYLVHLGECVLFNTEIETLIDECINTYGYEYAADIYNCLMKTYGDRIVDDLYYADIPNFESKLQKFNNSMIIPVKKEHWRF